MNTLSPGFTRLSELLENRTLRSFLNRETLYDAAADEIEALRASLTRQSKVLAQALKEKNDLQARILTAPGAQHEIRYKIPEPEFRVGQIVEYRDSPAKIVGYSMSNCTYIYAIQWNGWRVCVTESSLKSLPEGYGDVRS